MRILSSSGSRHQVSGFSLYYPSVPDETGGQPTPPTDTPPGGQMTAATSDMIFETKPVISDIIRNGSVRNDEASGDPPVNLDVDPSVWTGLFRSNTQDSGVGVPRPPVKRDLGCDIRPLGGSDEAPCLELHPLRDSPPPQQEQVDVLRRYHQGHPRPLPLLRENARGPADHLEEVLQTEHECESEECAGLFRADRGRWTVGTGRRKTHFRTRRIPSTGRGRHSRQT